jgi:hypothetical protein
MNNKSEQIGLTIQELEQIQNELKENLANQIQKLIADIQKQTYNDDLDIISVIAEKDSISLQSSIEFTQKTLEANNKKLADLINARDTLVLQTAIEFTQRAIEANNKKIFEYIEKKLNSIFNKNVPFS